MSHKADPHPPAETMSSVKRDVAHLKEHGSASVSELREFLAKMQGKSPKEMLGSLAESRLVSATTFSALLIGVVLLTFTIIPFTLSKAGAIADGAKEKLNEAATAAAAIADDMQAKTEAAATEQSDTAADQGDAPPSADEMIDRLKIDEAREAPPGINPLDGGLDDLFDDLK